MQISVTVLSGFQAFILIYYNTIIPKIQERTLFFTANYKVRGTIHGLAVRS